MVPRDLTLVGSFYDPAEDGGQVLLRASLTMPTAPLEKLLEWQQGMTCRLLQGKVGIRIGSSLWSFPLLFTSASGNGARDTAMSPGAKVVRAPCWVRAFSCDEKPMVMRMRALWRRSSGEGEMHTGRIGGGRRLCGETEGSLQMWRRLIGEEPSPYETDHSLVERDTTAIEQWIS